MIKYYTIRHIKSLITPIYRGNTMKTTTNFKPLITKELSNKIYNLVNDFDYQGLPFKFELLSGDYNITEIEGNYVSG